MLKKIKYFYNFIKKRIEVYKNIKDNLNILRLLNLNSKYIKYELKKLNLNFYDQKLSWHYHLFAGFKERLKYEKKIKILEIGTHNGIFAEYLSKLFLNSEIYTIDLKENDPRFINSYKREIEKERIEFIIKRNLALKNKNIKFIELDSSQLTKKFCGKCFDLIWIDGDHLNPQVTMDINSCFYLLKNTGIMLCDNVIMKNNPRFKLSDDSSYKTLKLFEKNKLLFNFFVLKRINQDNNSKKYMSISFKNKIFLK